MASAANDQVTEGRSTKQTGVPPSAGVPTRTNRTEPEAFLEAIILGIMVACVMLSVVALVGGFGSGWQGGYLAPLCGLVTVEGFYSRRLLGGQSRLAHLIELAAIFLALQVGIDLANGSPIIAAGIPRFDAGAAAAFIPVLLAWLLGSSISAILASLHAPLLDRPPGPVPPLSMLTNWFFWGGILLFATAALSQPSVARFLHLPFSGSPGPVANVLLYFLLGILFLAQVRYVALQQRWEAHRVTIAGTLGSRWLRYTLIFIALVALLAIVLPTSRTADALVPGREIWNGVINVLHGPLTWLLRLLGHTAHRPFTSPPPRIKPPAYLHGPPPHVPPHPAPHHGHGAGNIFTLARAAAFWLLLGAAVLYLARTYRLRRPSGIRIRGVAPVMRFLSSLWNALRRLLGRYGRGLANRLPEGVTVAAMSLPLTGTGLHLPGSGTMTAREQVQRYFLNIVRRAERRGLHRHGSQTPREFAGHLGNRLPEVGDDMTALTDAFLKARYSRHPVEDPEVHEARSHWQQVRAALRRLSTP